MTEGESKVNNVRWYQWLWDQLGKFIKKLNRFLIWIVSLGGAGAGLWFAGAWIVGSIKSCQAEEAARDLWASQHKTYEIGWLLPLASNEKGTDFYKILNSSGQSDKLVMIIQMKKDGGVFKTKDIYRDHVFLVDTLIERPEVKLISMDYARRVWEKEEPYNDLTIWMRKYVTVSSTYNHSNEDKLYIYINKNVVHKYIILDD